MSPTSYHAAPPRARKIVLFWKQQVRLAEAVRFELTEGSHPRRFSRPLHSTALPRFRNQDEHYKGYFKFMQVLIHFAVENRSWSTENRIQKSARLITGAFCMHVRIRFFSSPRCRSFRQSQSCCSWQSQWLRRALHWHNSPNHSLHPDCPD